MLNHPLVHAAFVLIATIAVALIFDEHAELALTTVLGACFGASHISNKSKDKA